MQGSRDDIIEALSAVLKDFPEGFHRLRARRADGVFVRKAVILGETVWIAAAQGANATNRAHVTLTALGAVKGLREVQRIAHQGKE